MELIRLPNEKEIEAAYEEGKEAVLKLFQKTIVVVAERIQKLEDQLAKNSARQAMDLISQRHTVCLTIINLSAICA